MMIFRSGRYTFEDYSISLYASSIKGKFASNKDKRSEMDVVVVVVVVVKQAPACIVL